MFIYSIGFLFIQIDGDRVGLLYQKSKLKHGIEIAQ
jgi:hypothetical protein